MDVLTERVGKEAPESMLFADDIVLCGDKDVERRGYPGEMGSVLQLDDE